MRRRVAWSHYFVSIAVSASFVCSTAPNLNAAPAARKLIAVKTKVPPTIDGKLDEACWKAAAEASGFSVFKNPDALHPEPTIGRVCFDDDNLYISMECRVNDMDKFKSRLAETGDRLFENYYKGGVIEVFLDTNHDQLTFQQYLLHANGSSMVTLSKGDVFKILNEDYLSSKVAVTGTGFNIEMSFPLAMLHLHPDTAKIWGFNLNRCHDVYGVTVDTNGLFSSWNSTLARGFQNPELFGELVMDDDFSRFYWQVDFENREPQPGDADIRLRVVNETGRRFAGKLLLRIVRPDGKAAKYEKRVSWQIGEEKTISFPHAVSADDADAKYEVSLRDAAGRTCYLGGTQKQDLTPGDSWPAPAPTATQRQAGYIVFHRPYRQPVLYKAVPRSREITSNLSISACPGEFEPVTFSLFPMRDVKSLAVSVSDLSGPQGAAIAASAIDIRKVSWQSDWKDPRTFEAKQHLLRRFDSLNLAKGRNQRLWLTVKVPEKLPAGDYRGTVTLSSGGVKTKLTLKVRVLPFELSPPDEMGYFMYAPIPEHKSISNPEFFKKIVEDMRDHGMTTFTIYHYTFKKDKLTGKYKLHVDDKVSGNLGVTYAQMIDILRQGGLGVNAPLIDLLAPHYGAEMVVALNDVYKARGWPEVVFYVGDEIDHPERLAKARRKLEAIMKISPDVKTTTALGPAGAAALGHIYDVWIGASSPEMVSKARAMGKKPWVYSSAQTFTVGPAFVRTHFGRFAWKRGWQGVALWCYAEDNTFYDRFARKYGYKGAAFGRQQDDEGFTFSPEWTHRHGHVYFENGEVIPSVTWEAVREGIDDYRYMLTLKKLADKAAADDDAGIRAAGQAGLKLLEEISDRTPIDKRDTGAYGRDWQAMGDMDAERTRVIEAVVNLLKVTMK